MSRWGTLVLLACGLLVSGTAAARPKPVAAQAKQEKRIAVAVFEAPSGSKARVAVLTTLSEHDDLEVVPLDDIAMAGKRLQAKPDDPEGRRKISEELGIDAWVDGTVDDESAQVTLRAPDGRTLAVANLSGDSSKQIDRLIGQRMWTVMGKWLSSREQRQRVLDAQYELALKKVRAREQEVVRQRELVKTRAAARLSALAAAQALAKQKRAAYTAEITRQRELVAVRAAQRDREQKLEEDRRLAQEEAEFAASLRESAGPTGTSSANTNVWTSAAQPTAAMPRAAAAAPVEPTVRPAPAASPHQAASGFSPWSMYQNTPVSRARTPEYAPAAMAPAPAPAGATTGSDPKTAGLSPATQRWLEAQQLQR